MALNYFQQQQYAKSRAMTGLCRSATIGTTILMTANRESSLKLEHFDQPIKNLLTIAWMKTISKKP
jgi:hypothetical protein